MYMILADITQNESKLYLFGGGVRHLACFGLAVGGTLGPCSAGAPIWTSYKHSTYSACCCIRALGRQHILWFIPSIRSVHDERVGFWGWGGRNGSGRESRTAIYIGGPTLKAAPWTSRVLLNTRGGPETKNKRMGSRSHIMAGRLPRNQKKNFFSRVCNEKGIDSDCDRDFFVGLVKMFWNRWWRLKCY